MSCRVWVNAFCDGSYTPSTQGIEKMRVQGWDPVLIICQIMSIQTIHYLTLSLLLPALLASFTSPPLLHYSGGPTTVGHVMDWREMAARSTAPTSFRVPFGGAWSGGKQVGTVPEDRGIGAMVDDDLWDYGVDEKRGWTIGLAWLIACAIDILPLYYLVRRPTHILDFALTLNFNHLILTTYYAKSFPTSIYYWVVQALGALLMIVVSEQLCVKREMNSDLDIGWDADREAAEVIELNER